MGFYLVRWEASITLWETAGQVSITKTFQAAGILGTLVSVKSTFDFGDESSDVRAPGAPSGFGQESSPPAASPPPAPASQPPSVAARGAGVAIIFAAIGGGVGAVLGGPWGLGAGILLAGAVRNGARARSLWASADELEREEAAKSATMGVVGAAGAGYLAYRAYRRKDDS